MRLGTASTALAVGRMWNCRADRHIYERGYGVSLLVAARWYVAFGLTSRGRPWGVCV